MPDTLLKVEGLNKAYNAPVLIDFELELRSGEIHALVGSNGAGKSTLAKILTGLTDFSSGSLTLDGSLHQPKNKQEATDAGVVMVLQELNTIPNLNVAENLFFHELPSRYGIVSKKQLLAKAKDALALVKLEHIDPLSPAASLGVGQRQLIEIAAALSQKCKLLILDEPTATLTDPEIDSLFAQMRALAKKGVAILYVSHRMEEIRAVCHRVSIMRDGKRINTYDTESVDNQTIIRDMAGKDVWSRPQERRDFSTEPTTLQASGLALAPLVKNVNLHLKKGEILGLAGLVGSGRTETLRLLFGADQPSAGQLTVNDAPALFQHPADAVACGIGMIPEDRKGHGLLLDLSIRENATLATSDLYSKFGYLSQEKESQEVNAGCQRLEVKYDHLEQAIKELSGGNQQKVVLLRWLLRNSDILLLDEPTRGVDVVAKESIYQLLRELSAQGKSLIIVSSELLELMALCDRIAVISDGSVSQEFTPDDWSQEAITQAAFSAYLNAS